MDIDSPDLVVKKQMKEERNEKNPMIDHSDIPV